MKISFVKEEVLYDGSQLASHFALKRFGVKGDSLVVFQGPMDVSPEHMADLEDLLGNQAIRSASMVHFIAEFHGANLETTVLKQRLLARLAGEILSRETGTAVLVRGDDLFVQDKKLSVSIAAPSPVSCLIHFGLNIDTRDVPVEAAGLKELGMDPERMGALLSQAFKEEMESIHWALCKVRGVS